METNTVTQTTPAQTAATATPVAPATTTAQVLPTASNPPKAGEGTIETPKEDLITRASKVKIEKQVTTEANPFGLTKDDYDKVTNDPVLSKYYKSMQADYIKKTQSLADLQKQADTLIKTNANWTPERLQAEMNKPDFIQAATQVVKFQNPSNSGLTDEEYSALNDKEKAQLQGMRQELNNLQMQNWNMQQKQQDEILKNRYANYNSDVVDTTIKDLQVGKVNANREYIWKAIDYDEAVNRAYQLGLQDRNVTITEKQQASSPTGFNTVAKTEIPPINQGESNRDYFKRLANARLEEAKGRNQ